MRDVRLALNEISSSTREIVSWFRDNVRVHYRLPVITYDMPVNACKYPVMRRMVLDDPDPPAKWVMWFDDDSYLNGGPGWWDRLQAKAANADMLGQVWFQAMRGKQWEWIARQRWFNPAVGKPPKRRFAFCTGGWWMLKSAHMKQNDWPSVELRHRGGDSLLGELCRHRQYRIVSFDDGLRINADDRGRHSKSPRRGVDEKVLGLSDVATDLSHQRFAMTRVRYDDVQQLEFS